ncbi:MAG: carboxypeptidase-like regulatory domain-containing protein, partial [Ignavibacteria bacterium]
MTKKILFLVCFLMVVSLAWSQTYTVSGSVISSDTKEAIIGATIKLTPGNYGAITGNTGEYSIKNIPKGNFTIKIEFIGYTTFSKEITVNKNIVYDVALKTGNITTEVIE